MTLLVLDVSQYQATTPDLTGVSALISQATIGTTPRANFPMHDANARKAGILSAAYHFNYAPLAVSPQVTAFLKAAPDADGYALDRENDTYVNAQNVKVTIPMFTPAQCREFISRMHDAGKKIGLYASESVFADFGQDWDWIANYSQKPTKHWDLWQYGPYHGIDASHFNGTLADLAALLGAGMNALTLTDSTPKIVTPKVGTQLYRPDGTALVKVSVPSATPSPYAVALGAVAFRVVPTTTGGVKQLALVHTADVTLADPPPVVAGPDTTPFSQADLDAAKAAGYAAAKAKASAAVTAI